MKQKGKCLIGDPIRVDRFTADWMSVRLHPGIFYKRMEQIQSSLDRTKGIYAELDLGQYVVIRFSEKDDVTAFHRMHHEYI